MVSVVVPVKLLDSNNNEVIIVAGNDVALIVTLQKELDTFDITNSTVTCSIRSENSPDYEIENHAVVLTTPSSGIVTLTLLDTDTLNLKVPSKRDMIKTIKHYGDFKVIESNGDVTNCGPFSFLVRRKIT